MSRSRIRRPLAGLVPPLLLTVLAAAGAAAAEAADAAHGVDSVLPGFSLPDQHGEVRSLDGKVKLLLFSRDMEGGKLIQQALERADAAFLSDRGAVYVSDVSRMPAFVRRFIAKPRMRRRPYPMLLDEDGAATARFPSREGHATLLFLDALRITRVGVRPVRRGDRGCPGRGVPTLKVTRSSRVGRARGWAQARPTRAACSSR